MPSLNWEDVREVTIDQARQAIVDHLQLIGFKATSWQRLSIPLACVEIGALLWNKGSQVSVFVKNVIFNDTATGEGLTRLSRSHYDNEREKPREATRRVTLACAATEGPHTIDVGDVVISDAAGHTFRNVDEGDVEYPATLTSGGSLEGMIFEAEEAGEAWNVPDGDVTILVTTLAGVTVTSDELETEGVGAEEDTRLQERNQTKWALLTGFELIEDAVKAIILNAVPSITTVQVHGTNPRGPGTFDVYVSGAVQTASAEAVTAAQDALDPYIMGNDADLEPEDRECYVKPAEELELNLVGTVYFRKDFGSAVVRQAVEDALEAFLRDIPLGGFDYAASVTNTIPKNDIEAVIKGVVLSGTPCVRTVVIDTPSGNVPVGNFRKVVRGDWSGLAYVAAKN